MGTFMSTFGCVVRSLAVAGSALLLVPASAAGQQQGAPSCSAPEYRQFDFWLGDWEVSNSDGDVVGTNTVTSIIGGCAVHEQWEGTGGGIGESLNAYDRRTGSWHQTWVGGRGLVLHLDGGLHDGSMMLAGELQTPNGVEAQRITWTPADDGSVRQLWERSADGGATWTKVFDGTYRKKQ